MPIRKLSLVLGLLVLFCGCSDDDNPVVVPPASPPGVASADLVVSQYITALTDMDQSALENLLHPDYLMLLNPATTQLYPNVGSSLDRAAQMRVAARMFSGKPLIDPDDNLVPGIGSIGVDRFAQQDGWVETTEGQFSGSMRGLFGVVITCYRPGFASMRVSGELVLFAADADTVIAGTSHTYWQLIGLQDLTGGFFKSNESISWSEIQALYWVPE